MTAIPDICVTGGGCRGLGGPATVGPKRALGADPMNREGLLIC